MTVREARPEAFMTNGITGGAGGARGPGGPGGPGGPTDVDEVDGAEDAEGAGAAAGAAAAAGPATGVDRIAADLDAGRITGREAIDRLIDEAVPGELGAAERAELREAMVDLIANDPHLAALAARLGAARAGGDD